MEYLAIGFTIGSVLGLTGSGGALVAIPLFMMTGADIKAASFLSLIAVVLAGILNLISQFKQAQLKQAGLMIAASLVGSYALIPVKESVPNIVIVALLTLISLYSLFVMWQPKKLTNASDISTPLWMVLLVGFVLGALTTLTGLGGGVLLMPIFVGIFRLPMTQALATSLLTIVGSSFISFLLQWQKGASLPDLTQIFYLLAGMVVASLILSRVTRFVKPDKLNLIRQIVFSGIVVFAMIKFYS